MEDYSSLKSTYTFINGKILIRGNGAVKWVSRWSKMDLILCIGSWLDSFLWMYNASSLTCKFDSLTVNWFFDITDPENWVETNLLTSNLWVYVSSPGTCGLLQQKISTFHAALPQYMFAVCYEALAYWFSSVCLLLIYRTCLFLFWYVLS